MSLPVHPISLEEFALDPELGNFPAASPGQRLVLRLLDGLPPADAEQRAIFETIAGRPWAEDLLEARAVVALVMGVSSGKSVIGAEFLVHRALFADISERRPGQRAIALLIAPDVKTAQDTTFGYALGIVERSAVISEELAGPPTIDTIRFKRGTELSILAAAHGGRGHRGRRFVGAVMEEMAFWREEGSAVSDVDAVRATLPRLMTGAQLVAISTPWRRSGWMYDLHAREWGKSARALVLQADTATMRPDISKRKIEDAYEDDGVSARAEYGAEFLEGMSTLLSPDDIERAIDRGVTYRAPEPGWTWTAAQDPSSLRNDPWAFSIVGKKGDVFAQFVCRFWRPGAAVESIVAEIAADLRLFGIRSLLSDQWGSAVVEAIFSRVGVVLDVRPFTVAANSPKTLGFRALKEVLASDRMRLLDNPTQERELRNLEVTRLAGGGERIAAPGRQHDDIACSVALCMHGAAVVQENEFFLAVMAREAARRNLQRLQEELQEHPLDRERLAPAIEQAEAAFTQALARVPEPAPKPRPTQTPAQSDVADLYAQLGLR